MKATAAAVGRKLAALSERQWLAIIITVSTLLRIMTALYLGNQVEVLPGTFGRVWIKDDPRLTILVPVSAVYAIGQLELVQVVRGNRIIRRLVKTGPRMGDAIEILSGLEDGDTILVDPVKG